MQTLGHSSKSPEPSSQASSEVEAIYSMSQEDHSTVTHPDSQDRSGPPSHATIENADSQIIETSIMASSQETDIDQEDVLEVHDSRGFSISRVEPSMSASGLTTSEEQQMQITTSTDAVQQESSTQASDESPSNNASVVLSHHNAELGHTSSTETVETEVDDPPQSNVPDETEASNSASTEINNSPSNHNEDEWVEAQSGVSSQEASSQEASSQEVSSEEGSTDQSAPTSAGTEDEPSVITPNDQFQSDMEVTDQAGRGDVSFGTPPLLTDDDDSMLADTSIDTVDSGAVVFYNGDVGRNSPADFFTAKTDSGSEEDSSDDEEVPLVPRLLTYAIPTPRPERIVSDPSQNQS